MHSLYLSPSLHPPLPLLLTLFYVVKAVDFWTFSSQILIGQVPAPANVFSRKMPAGCSCSFLHERAQASLLLSPSLRPQLERRGTAPYGVRRETSWCQDAFSAVGEGGLVLQLSDGMGGRPGCAKAPSVHLGKGAPPYFPPSPRPPILHSRRCRSPSSSRRKNMAARRGEGARRPSASGGLVSNRIGTSPALIVAQNPFPPSFFRCLT